VSAAPAKPPLKRAEVHPAPLVDGRPVRVDVLARLRRRAQRLLVSDLESEEAAIEHRLRIHPGVTRPNSLALISPKGGVGKTTATFLVGNLLASHLNLKAIAIDANPDFGTLARLAPDSRRSPQSLVDVLQHADELRSAAELTPYVSRLPTGLHLLGAPPDAELSARLKPEAYGELVAFLSTFYDVVLLDLGTGVVGPLVRFVTQRADRVVVVTTPEWVTASVVLEALTHLWHDHATVAINKSLAPRGDKEPIEDRFRSARLHRAVTIPYDEALAAMLDTGTYSLEALRDPTRIAIKRLGLAVAEQLV
jgi:MinD-like ATPase involved in chromosome partitioning or flagellar assembly